jgi:large subunit ribosomal protein L21
MKQLPEFDKYAIFQTGGKQYQALEGRTVAIEKIEGEAGQKIQFSDVLLRKVSDKVQVGTPFLSEPITASIVKQTKGPKLTIFKFRRREKVRVKKGHRQPLTVVRIDSI